MRRVQLGFWCAGVVLASASPAFCQIITEPTGSGRSVPSNAQVGLFRETVFTSGDVTLALKVFHNTTLKYSAKRIVLTSGPSFIVCADVPLGTFGLVAGDSLTFLFVVRHLTGCDAGTATHVAALIPVVAPCGTTDPPETTWSSLERPGGQPGGALAYRRRDERSEDWG